MEAFLNCHFFHHRVLNSQLEKRKVISRDASAYFKHSSISHRSVNHSDSQMTQRNPREESEDEAPHCCCSQTGAHEHSSDRRPSLSFIPCLSPTSFRYLFLCHLP